MLPTAKPVKQNYWFISLINNFQDNFRNDYLSLLVPSEIYKVKSISEIGLFQFLIAKCLMLKNRHSDTQTKKFRDKNVILQKKNRNT